MRKKCLYYEKAYVFINKQGDEITLMKLEREFFLEGFHSVNYILIKGKRKWKKISIDKFNSLKLEMIGEYDLEMGGRSSSNYAALY